MLVAPVWSRRLTGRGWPKPLADAASVALAAQLVTAPLVAGVSGSVSLVAVAAAAFVLLASVVAAAEARAALGDRAATAADLPLALIEGAPHGFNVSHAKEFNQHLLAFLAQLPK